MSTMNTLWSSLLNGKQSKKEQKDEASPDSDENDVQMENENNQSEKSKKFAEILSKANKPKEYSHSLAKKVSINMSYHRKCDCIICKCGSRLWVAKNVKRGLKDSDLYSHLREVKHSKWQSIQKRTVCLRLQSMNRVRLICGGKTWS